MQPFAAAVAASIIVKHNEKNHVLLLHLDEKLQKTPVKVDWRCRTNEIKIFPAYQNAWHKCTQISEF